MVYAFTVYAISKTENNKAIQYDTSNPPAGDTGF
jgi:hypothetical protein